jgi:hypothetical protein
MLDVNKDGHLSEDELFDGLLRRGWNQDELQNLFGTLDLNGDGKISKSEYLDGMSRLLNGKQKVISLPAPTMACQHLSGSKAVLNGDSAMCLFFEVPQESANTKATGNAKSHVEFLTNVRVEDVKDRMGQVVQQLCADGKEMMGNKSADWFAQKAPCPFAAKFAMYLVPAQLFKQLGKIKRHEDLLEAGSLIRIDRQRSHTVTDAWYDGYGVYVVPTHPTWFLARFSRPIDFPQSKSRPRYSE